MSTSIEVMESIDRLRRGEGERDHEFNGIRINIIKKYLEGEPGDDDWTDEELEILVIIAQDLEAHGIQPDDEQIKVTFEDLLSLQRL